MVTAQLLVPKSATRGPAMEHVQGPRVRRAPPRPSRPSSWRRRSSLPRAGLRSGNPAQHLRSDLPLDPGNSGQPDHDLGGNRVKRIGSIAFLLVDYNVEDLDTLHLHRRPRRAGGPATRLRRAIADPLQDPGDPPFRQDARKDRFRIGLCVVEARLPVLSDPPCRLFGRGRSRNRPAAGVRWDRSPSRCPVPRSLLPAVGCPCEATPTPAGTGPPGWGRRELTSWEPRADRGAPAGGRRSRPSRSVPR